MFGRDIDRQKSCKHGWDNLFQKSSVEREYCYENLIFSSTIVKHFIDEIVISASTLQTLEEHCKVRTEIEDMRNKDVRGTTSAIEVVTTSVTNIMKRSFEEKKRTTKRTRIHKDSKNEDIENNPFYVLGEKLSIVSFQDQFSPFLDEKSSNDKSEDDEIVKESGNIDEANISEEIDGDQSSDTTYNDPRDVSSSLISIMEEYCKKDSTSKFDPAHSYILDLISTSKIIKEFTLEHCLGDITANLPQDKQFELICAVSMKTEQEEIATEYRLQLYLPILDQLKRERHLQSPQDVYHLMARKVLRFLKIMIEALSPERRTEFTKSWKSFEYPRTWHKLPNLISHIDSFIISDCLWLTMMIPFILNHCISKNLFLHHFNTE
ncbi:hypothetical protein C1645_839506 [Glomus cerebriforme]|uniref:Uncharacterized protein n=1 Tax=Glomus cerebriforme TaxID=658196 RepID=A0A397SC87_9GLOM|nr:hypothetical protein C1645_839506 [Glomus cerebriforme]